MLGWRITFSEAVANVDAADFTLGGTTAQLAVSRATYSYTTYDFTAFGGDLWRADATVTLGFASGHDIEDTAGNALTDTAPARVDDSTYVVDNTAPTVAIAIVPVENSATSVATFTFSEPVSGFVLWDIMVGNGAVSAFTRMAGGMQYTAVVTPAAAGAATVRVAANAARDAAGNGSVSSEAGGDVCSGAMSGLGDRRLVWTGAVTVGGTDRAAASTRARGSGSSTPRRSPSPPTPTTSCTPSSRKTAAMTATCRSAWRAA